MSRKKKIPQYSKGEELCSSLSHGAGFLLSAAALVYMIVVAVQCGDPLRLFSVIVYGTTMMVLYAMSACYHAVRGEKLKGIFRTFDHCAIFLLIAGTYTPYTLITLRGAVGWTIFGIIWGMAILGIVLNAIDMEKFSILSLICYVVMGWAVVFAVRPLVAGLSSMGLSLLVAGGIVYTVGIIFYLMKRVPYMHALWHLFVLGGSTLHLCSVIFCVLPAM